MCVCALPISRSIYTSIFDMCRMCLRTVQPSTKCVAHIQAFLQQMNTSCFAVYSTRVWPCCRCQSTLQ